MPHIALVAPHFLENTNRYVKAFTNLEGVKLSVISEDAEKALPKALRERIAGHYQIKSVGAASELARAIKGIQKGLGPVDRLTGALEQLQLPMAEARELTGVPGMRPEIARRFRDKDVMKEVLRKKGVPVAASALVSSPKELQAFVDRVGLPIIVKPQAGVGSRGTHRIETKDDVKAVIEKMPPSAKSPLQAEQFIRAREFTCETVSIHGKTVWRSGTRYFPTPLEVLETPWMQYCVMLPREVEAPWTDFAPINEAALQALFGDDPKVVGTAITHMEWFLKDDGKMFVSEVGARPPGVQIMPLMSIANEVDMIAKWAELIAFDRFTPPPARKWAGGAAMFRGQGNGKRIVEVKGLKKALELVGDALVDIRAPKVGMARASGYEGEGFALVRHPKTEGVKTALLALIENVQVRYG